MPDWLIVVLCAVAAVGLFVLGMSLTLMIKGHHIDSEISTNKNMQRLGIKCAVQETREAEQAGGGGDGKHQSMVMVASVPGTGIGSLKDTTLLVA